MYVNTYVQMCVKCTFPCFKYYFDFFNRLCNIASVCFEGNAIIASACFLLLIFFLILFFVILFLSSLRIYLLADSCCFLPTLFCSVFLFFLGLISGTKYHHRILSYCLNEVFFYRSYLPAS